MAPRYFLKSGVSMKNENEPTYDKHELATGICQVHTMKPITHQKPQSAALTNKWLRRACTTGFVFFLAKGLVWVVAAIWVVY